MKEGITIRAYRKADREKVLTLLQLNTPAYFAPEEEKALDRYLAYETELYYVLEKGGALVGCGGINFADNGATGKISWDIVHPSFQGLGLGKLLLDHRLRVLKARDRVQKITVRTSQQAYRFYEKSGFRLTQAVKDYWAEGFDLYFMEYEG